MRVGSRGQHPGTKHNTKNCETNPTGAFNVRTNCELETILNLIYRAMKGEVCVTGAEPAEHPLRPLRTMVDDILKEMSPRFAELYADRGWPSIPPERLLRALLLQILYTVRSERLLMEQLNYNLLFRWFVGMGMDEVVWTARTGSGY